MGDLAELRRVRSDAMDAMIGEILESVVGTDPPERMSVVAVGGYGRRELSPFSDIDLVLVHEPSVPARRVSAIADGLWYPLWDLGIPLDHAVRDSAQMRATADNDLRAALGMLDARHVAGDPDLTGRLRTGVLERWRRRARSRLPELAESTRRRAETHGELAYAAAPDLKESSGGLRDGVSLRALVATWLVDIPHEESESYRQALLDIRDVLHAVSGRRTDRLGPELVADVALARDAEPDQLMFEVRDLGRRTAHLTRSAWHRIAQVTPPPLGVAPRIRRRRPQLSVLAKGVAEASGQIVLTADADPASDPLLVLRAATLAVERGLLMASASATRLARATPVPEPWPAAARQLLARMLSAGSGLPPVWQELDQVGIVDRWLPEWGHIRLRSSTALVHAFTIDRHSVEACVRAADLVRSVRRPDLLVTAALLHDIGKGRSDDHCELGAPMAEEIALRWGFSAVDAHLVGRLVRLHLLLPFAATRRDLNDPETAAGIAAGLTDLDELDLLTALTEADAAATSPAAWSPWRRGLIRQLVAQVRDLLADRPHPFERGGEPVLVDPAAPGQQLGLTVEPAVEGSVITVSAPDRGGLLADVAGILALSNLSIRSARAQRQGTRGVMSWEVGNADVDGVRLRHRLERLMDGPSSVADRLDEPAHLADLPARVAFLPGASESASVLEVRAADHRGLVSRVCRVIAECDAFVRSAHIETLGHQAADVFYLVGADGGRLPPDLETTLVTRVTGVLG